MNEQKMIEKLLDSFGSEKLLKLTTQNLDVEKAKPGILAQWVRFAITNSVKRAFNFNATGATAGGQPLSVGEEGMIQDAERALTHYVLNPHLAPPYNPEENLVTALFKGKGGRKKKRNSKKKRKSRRRKSRRRKSRRRKTKKKSRRKQ